ncbi:hypothetical protein Ahy_B01g055867 isoform B [Arachis hypogaea]|uniref:Uncharacterized protein n=1 Tax=Arachis hypogaea TaxID=3818 RepID=A0A445AXF2_ARAHY|nr:hypothetical protein Ahy_B01g055867 isoform B [Arachis hypogaea]
MREKNVGKCMGVTNRATNAYSFKNRLLDQGPSSLPNGNRSSVSCCPRLDYAHVGRVGFNQRKRVEGGPPSLLLLRPCKLEVRGNNFGEEEGGVCRVVHRAGDEAWRHWCRSRYVEPERCNGVNREEDDGYDAANGGENLRCRLTDGDAVRRPADSASGTGTAAGAGKAGIEADSVAVEDYRRENQTGTVEGAVSPFNEAQGDRHGLEDIEADEAHSKDADEQTVGLKMGWSPPPVYIKKATLSLGSIPFYYYFI